MRFGCCHNGGRFSPHESEGDFFFEKPSLYAFVKEGDMLSEEEILSLRRNEQQANMDGVVKPSRKWRRSQKKLRR